MRAPLLPLIAALVFVPSIARAQDLASAPCSNNINGGIVNYGIGNAKASPFTAVARSSFEQRLYDGNVIRSEVIIRQARDSSGRTLEERQEGCGPGLDGALHPRIGVTISDPQAQESINWTVGDPLTPKLVRIVHFQQPSQRPTPIADTPEGQQLRAALQRLQQLQAKPQHDVAGVEQLGTRTFLGVEANGTRTTQTIPAGMEGNEQPLVIVNETWRSRALGLIMYAIRDDPRRGKSTFEYTSFTLGEPDLSLFTPPADYKVQEIYPGGDPVGMVTDGAATPVR